MPKFWITFKGSTPTGEEAKIAATFGMSSQDKEGKRYFDYEWGTDQKDLDNLQGRINDRMERTPSNSYIKALGVVTPIQQPGSGGAAKQIGKGGGPKKT